METVRARLAGLIEFVKQTALMQKRPALTLSQHNAFSASEEKLRALPGVSLDLHNDEEDEVWLQLERLHETKPPAPLSPLLALWIELKGTPQTEPVLKVRLAREVLINSTAISEDERSRLMPVALQIGEDVGVEEWVNLEDCLDAGEIRAQFKSYSQTAWRLGRRRKTTPQKHRAVCRAVYAGATDARQPGGCAAGTGVGAGRFDVGAPRGRCHPLPVNQSVGGDCHQP